MKLRANWRMLLGFLLETLLPMFLQVRASTTVAPFLTSPSPLISTAQNPTSESQRPTEVSMALTTLAPQEATTFTTQTSTFESPAPTQTPTSPSLSSGLPPGGPTSSYTAAATNTNQGPVTLKEDQVGGHQVEKCEEYNKKTMLICFIIIGALVFICVFLLLVIVAMASKLSHLKRKRPSKRLPRSNGDFLSTNNLWPAGLETLQRLSNDTTGTDQTAQRSGPERKAAGHEEAGEEIGKKLVKEITSRQQHQETPAKPPKSPIARAEI